MCGGEVSPEHLYQRQQDKANVLVNLLDRLGIKPGDRIVDVGSGPGFMSIMAAERTGSHGRVWAVDVWAEALDYLGARCTERSIDWVHPIVADAVSFAVPMADIDCFIVVDMLHHVDDAQAVIRHLAEIFPKGARGVVSDFRMVAEREFGPDLAMRIPEERMRAWLTAAGLMIVSAWHPPDEHYAFLVKKP